MVKETISSQYCNLHSYTMWLAVLFMWRASMYETAELYYYLMLSNGLSNQCYKMTVIWLQDVKRKHYDLTESRSLHNSDKTASSSCLFLK